MSNKKDLTEAAKILQKAYDENKNYGTYDYNDGVIDKALKQYFADLKIQPPVIPVQQPVKMTFDTWKEWDDYTDGIAAVDEDIKVYHTKESVIGRAGMSWDDYTHDRKPDIRQQRARAAEREAYFAKFAEAKAHEKVAKQEPETDLTAWKEWDLYANGPAAVDAKKDIINEHYKELDNDLKSVYGESTRSMWEALSEDYSPASGYSTEERDKYVHGLGYNAKKILTGNKLVGKPQMNEIDLAALKLEKAKIRAAKAAEKARGHLNGETAKRTRQPSYKKDDRVETPNGPGNIWSVDRDGGLVCVELDSDPSILHEFEKFEIKKIK